MDAINNDIATILARYVSGGYATDDRVKVECHELRANCSCEGDGLMTIHEQIAVMQAFADGKTIECRYGYSDGWKVTDKPRWDWISLDYRVKPESPREWWINTYTTRQEAHDTKEAADDCASRSRIACIHVREVID